MADKPFDVPIFNHLEVALEDDFNQGHAQQRRTLQDLLRDLYAGRVSAADASAIATTGFVSTGFLVGPGGGMSVGVTPGVGFYDDGTSVPTNIGGVAHLDDLSPYKPLVLSAVETLAVAAPPGGFDERYDIIEVRYNRLAGNPQTRGVLNTTTGVDVPTVVSKTLGWDLAGLQGSVVSPAASAAPISYKRGVVAGPGAGVVPATTVGYVKLATLYVNFSTVAITAASIADQRALLAPSNIHHVACEFTAPFGVAGGVLHPALVSAVAPPGVRIALRNMGVDTQSMGDLGAGYIYILGGGFATCVPALAAELPNNAWITNVTVTTVDLTMQGILAAAVDMAAPVSVGLGTPVVRIGFEFVNLGVLGGTPFVTVNPTPPVTLRLSAVMGT